MRPILLLPALALLAAACSGSTPVDAGESPLPVDSGPRIPAGSPPPAQLTAAESRTVAASNEFSLALFREVSRKRAGRTLFLSPYSASAALGMTLNGARGETLEAMQTTKPRPLFPEEERWEQVVSVPLHAIQLGEMTVEEGLAKAQDDVNRMMMELGYY